MRRCNTKMKARKTIMKARKTVMKARKAIMRKCNFNIIEFYGDNNEI